MQKIKPHKSVEEIAKKHRLDISFVQKQLDMGIPIEHEHTRDKNLATDIALQHLDEIPDYYTRLKKMESSAKKEHKKFRDVSEGTLHHWFKGSKSKDGKPGWVQADGSPCANEPGETKTPKCFSSARLRALKRKGKKGEALIRSAVRRKRSKDKYQQQKSGGAKPTMVSTFAKGKKDKNYIKAEPGIRESMELNEAQKDKPGKGSGTKDACYHKVKSRYAVWPSAYGSASLVRCRKVGADNWGTKSEACWDGYKEEGMKKKGKKMVPNCVPIKENAMIRYCPKCKKDETREECKYGTKYWDMNSVPSKLSGDYHPNSPHPGNFPESYDHEYSMARSELATIASAVKRLKKKFKGEGNIEAWVQSKITKAADYIDTAADYVDSGEMKEEVASTDDKYKKFDIALKKIRDRQKNKKLTSKELIGSLRVAAKSRPMDEEASFEINPKKHKEEQKQKKIRKLKDTTTSKGEQTAAKSKLKGPELPFRESYEHSNWRADFGLSEDWQKANRDDGVNGMSQEVVNRYKREHPGSKLQTAVTEKNPTGKRKNRRSSYCSRSAGQRDMHNIDCSKTPDKPICKARKRWRCH